MSTHRHGLITIVIKNTAFDLAGWLGFRELSRVTWKIKVTFNCTLSQKQKEKKRQKQNLKKAGYLSIHAA